MRETVQALFDEARAAWPGVELPFESFAGHLAAHGSSAHAADVYLACACARGEPRALAAFEEHHLSRVPAMLGRRVRSQAELQEVLQVVRERLFVGADGEPPRIAEYAGKSSLQRWLRVVVLRIESNLHRAGDQHGELAREPAMDPLRAIDPELVAVVRRFGDAFNGAFRAAFDSLPPDERTLFRLHYIDGLDLARLGEALAVSRATAGRRLMAARERMRDATLGLLRARLALDESELSQLLGVVRSKLDLSLGGLLRER